MDGKVLKSAADYNFPSRSKHHCFRCVHFQQKEQRCEKVAGIVRNMGHCKLWEHKTPTYQRARKLLSEAPDVR